MTYSEIVLETASDKTPRINDLREPDSGGKMENEARVLDIEDIGCDIYVGGKFDEARDYDAPAFSPHRNLLSYNCATGRMNPNFNPSVGGTVEAIAVSRHGMFVGGQFEGGIARIDPQTGVKDPTFRANISGRSENKSLIVRGVAAWQDSLIAVGQFTTANGEAHSGIARFNAKTGDLEPFPIQFSEKWANGALGQETRTVFGYDVVINDQGIAFIVGNFVVRDQGVAHNQIVGIDLKTNTILKWATTQFDARCNETPYLRSISYTPDGSQLLISANGGPADQCDAVTKWQVMAGDQPVNGPGQTRLWYNCTGGDSIRGTESVGSFDFVSGHFETLSDVCGALDSTPAGTPRQFLGALNAKDGTVLAWRPMDQGRKGVGCEKIHATPRGIIFGCDTNRFSGKDLGKIAFFPLSQYADYAG